MRSEFNNATGGEIDLFEVVRNLWNQKLLVGGVTSFAAIVATIYAFAVTPVYEARIIVHPPMRSDIAALNDGRGGVSGLPWLTVKDVYDLFLSRLQAESTRYEYFENSVMPSLRSDESAEFKIDQFNRFNKSIVISGVSRDFPDKYLISVRSVDPKQAIKWVTEFPNLAADIAARAVIDNLKSDAYGKANNLEQQIISAQEVALNERVDKIVRLKDALSIAKSIGLKNLSQVSATDINDSITPIDDGLVYMRGVNALLREIESLESRGSDDPYIADLRKLQAGLKVYRNLDIDPLAFSVYRQDGDAKAPIKPVEPKKFIIILGGGIGGGGGRVHFCFNTSLSAEG